MPNKTDQLATLTEYLRKPGQTLRCYDEHDAWVSMVPATLGRIADVIEAHVLMEALRAPEGNAVTIGCDNPDFNGQPNNAIDVVADWGRRWESRRFTGDTILACLRAAAGAMAEVASA